MVPQQSRDDESVPIHPPSIHPSIVSVSIKTTLNATILFLGSGKTSRKTVHCLLFSLILDLMFMPSI